jgi:hypothetical protein
MKFGVMDVAMAAGASYRCALASLERGDWRYGDLKSVVEWCGDQQVLREVRAMRMAFRDSGKLLSEKLPSPVCADAR